MSVGGLATLSGVMLRGGEDAPCIVPPGEFGFDGYALLDLECLGDQWWCCGATEVGHIG